MRVRVAEKPTLSRLVRGVAWWCTSTDIAEVALAAPEELKALE